MVRLIRTEVDYNRALTEISELMRTSPAPGSPEAERLELLGLLVERYESEQLPQELPSPVAAIAFRMEQLGLTARDLVPILGSRARVSEILAGTRQLTLPMIRALNKTLGIPTASLVSTSDSVDESARFLPDRFPLRELVRRGWLESGSIGTSGDVKQALADFLSPLGGLEATALYRQSECVRASRDMDVYALHAWAARAVFVAFRSCSAHSVQHAVTVNTIRELFHLSVHADGPRRAITWLCERGIAASIVPHLPGTWLDGAAIQTEDGPVIGLTLRHDRVDNFWYTLAHELAHVLLHLRKLGRAIRAYFDDLDSQGGRSALEAEADALASDILVPNEVWNRSAVQHTPSPEAVQELATELGVHPAIVAGRVRFERRNYRLLSKLVGAGEVRPLFAKELQNEDIE